MNTHYYQAPPLQGTAKISGQLLAGLATLMIIAVIVAEVGGTRITYSWPEDFWEAVLH